MSLYLAVGHGLSPAGVYEAGVQNPSDGAIEHLLAFDVVKSAATQLRDAGVDVTSEADGSPYDDPDATGTLAHVSEGAYQAVVEVHFGWWEDAPGLVLQHATEAGHQLCGAISSAFGDHGLRVRTMEARGDVPLLAESRVPAVIVQVDRTRVFSPDELDEQGRALAQGVAAWLGVDQVAGMAPSAPTYTLARGDDAGNSETFDSADGALAAAKRYLTDTNGGDRHVMLSYGRSR